MRPSDRHVMRQYAAEQATQEQRLVRDHARQRANGWLCNDCGAELTFNEWRRGEVLCRDCRHE